MSFFLRFVNVFVYLFIYQSINPGFYKYVEEISIDLLDFESALLIYKTGLCMAEVWKKNQKHLMHIYRVLSHFPYLCLHLIKDNCMLHVVECLQLSFLLLTV